MCRSVRSVVIYADFLWWLWLEHDVHQFSMAEEIRVIDFGGAVCRTQQNYALLCTNGYESMSTLFDMFLCVCAVISIWTHIGLHNDHHGCQLCIPEAQKGASQQAHRHQTIPVPRSRTWTSMGWKDRRCTAGSRESRAWPVAHFFPWEDLGSWSSRHVFSCKISLLS